MPGTQIDYAAHSAYTDPGEWAELLDRTPTDPAELGAVARNVIAHYRVQVGELPESTRHEIDLRWSVR